MNIRGPPSYLTMLIFGVNAAEAIDWPFENRKWGHLKEIKEQISNKQYLFHHLSCCLCNPSYFSLRDSEGLSEDYLYQLRLWSKGFWHLISDRDQKNEAGVQSLAWRASFTHHRSAKLSKSLTIFMSYLWPQIALLASCCLPLPCSCFSFP